MKYPFPSCRIVLTQDANADGTVDWQDGAIALRRLTDGTIPGADRVRRSMVHSSVQMPVGPAPRMNTVSLGRMSEMRVAQ